MCKSSTLRKMENYNHAKWAIICIFVMGKCLGEITVPIFQKNNFPRKFEPIESNDVAQFLETIDDILSLSDKESQSNENESKAEKESREVEDYLPSPLCKEIRYVEYFTNAEYEYVPEYIPVVECQGSTNGTIDLTKEHSCPALHCRQKRAQIWIFRRRRGAGNRMWERLDKPREFYNGCECMAIVKAKVKTTQ